MNLFIGGLLYLFAVGEISKRLCPASNIQLRIIRGVMFCTCRRSSYVHLLNVSSARSKFTMRIFSITEKSLGSHVRVWWFSTTREAMPVNNKKELKDEGLRRKISSRRRVVMMESPI
ncbi:hypothetical protein KQX54_004689 [Cotesia glomerata]|uniref:Secreted protein n=1 Tax=Cotesia glomerata TaxID=32391 RepID=A0AAV7I0V7_COTGL|nr:hypothetical protein KQX54_004689 [Cotesia glomerata]